MSIRGSNFENQHPFASDHALVWERCMPDGLLYGVDMSFTSTLFTLGTGFMLVAGRMFEITAAESISISPGSGYARVYVAIDTGGAATETSFDQVSFGVDYAANLDSFAELTQGKININQGAAVYQAEVAVLEINSSGVTAIERQMELVSPGAGTGAFAAIAVTYPAGSTVTVTDGKITYTAPNTSGGALFIIPYAATWTVTATDGTDTARKTVEITTEGQSVSVELYYRLYFYKEGDQCVDITGGWNSDVTVKKFGTVTMSKITPTFAETAMILDLASAGTYDYVPVSSGLVDLTQIDTIYVEYDVPVKFYHARFLVSNTTTFATVDGSEAAANIEFEINVGDDYTLMLDVSALTGEYYIVAFSFRGESIDAKGKIQINNIWGE